MSQVRRVSLVLAFLLAACSRRARPIAAPPQPLYVPPLVAPRPSKDPLAVRFAEGSAAPSGCFALSRRTGAVACVLGQYGATTGSGERHLALLQSSEDAMPDIPIRVQATDSGVKLERQSQQTLDAIMREGDFIALDAPVFVPLDSPRSFAGLRVELRRASTSLAEELPPGALVYDLKVIVRPDGLTEEKPEDVLLENTLTSVACHAPSLAVRVLEPTVVLLERECLLDAGEPEVLVAAWLCDSERVRCD